MSLKKQLIINLSFTLVKSLFLLLSLNVADKIFSPIMMGFILLFRRQGVMVANLLQLGLSQSIKYFYLKEPDTAKKQARWFAQVKIVLFVSFLFVLFCSVFPEATAGVIIGESRLLIAVAFGFYTAGISVGYISGSSWASELDFVQYNIIDFLNSSVVFILCVLLLYPYGDVVFYVGWGGGSFIVAMISLSCFINKYEVSMYNNRIDISEYKELFSYSIPRGGSSFLDIACVTLGPWFLRKEPEQAGYLILAYSGLRVFQMFVMPVAQVLSLRANSYRFHQGEEVKRVLSFAALSVLCAAIVVWLYHFFGEIFIHLWVPNSARQVTLITDNFIYFMPALCLFYSLRNYVEIRYQFPWNFVTLIVSIIGLVVGYYNSSTKGIAAVVIGSQVMFGVLAISSILSFCMIAFNSSADK